MESHRAISVSWSKFARNITVELALDEKRRKSANDFLKVCRAEFDRLIEQAPLIEDDILKLFKTKFKDIDIIKPEICNGLHKCKIYKPSQEEKVANIVANAGDRFHDLKRRQAKFYTSIGDFEWNDPKLVYPIPQQEMDMNNNMIQNEGY